MTIAPYIALMRLDKPIGIWLLFFPAGWAVALAANPSDSGVFMLLMLLGSAITRAAGCILNDIADRKLDAQVARTQNRPLAAGTITVPQALVMLVLLLSAALALALSLPRQVFLLALLALPMIAAYPWMKRITWWPQAFLGLTFNLGALFGWLAVGEELSLPAMTLYAAAIFWTLGYDTIYAIQDMADDATVGIRSSARALGLGRIRPFVAGCYGLMVMLLALTGWQMGLGSAYYLALTLAGAHACWQISALPSPNGQQLYTPAHAGILFRSNQWLGLVVLAGILAGR